MSTSRLLFSVSYHYNNPTERFRLVQNGNHYLLIECKMFSQENTFKSAHFAVKQQALTKSFYELLIRVYKLYRLHNCIFILLNSDARLQPAFFAFLKQTPFTLRGINDVVKFEDVTVNRGQGYNPSTGVFTAPRNGLYYISCSIMAFSSSDVHYQLNKNDAVHTYGYSNKGGYMSSTINAIVEMKKGDRVFIKHWYKSSSQKINGNHQSTFSGYFIQE